MCLTSGNELNALNLNLDKLIVHHMTWTECISDSLQLSEGMGITLSVCSVCMSTLSAANYNRIRKNGKAFPKTVSIKKLTTK